MHSSVAASGGRAARILLAAAAIASFALAQAAGQDFGFGDAPAQADGAEAEPKAASRIALGGAIDYTARAYPDFDEPSISAFDSVPSARLTFSASGRGISAFARLKLDPATLADDPALALAEAWASASLGPLEIKGGLQRISWGVADSLRVLDVVSPRDYRAFTFREAEDQYLPQASLSAKLALGDRTSLQAVWTPFFEGDRYATSGKWVTKKAATLAKTVYTSLYTYLMTYVYPSNPAAAGLAAMQASDMAASFISYPDTASLKYSQVGGRLATSVGGVDLGAQYWYGFDRRPSYDMAAALASGTAEVSYDRLHHIGADAAFALGGFNFRLEGAANLTGDSDGSDATVHNRNLAWAAGVDKELLGCTVNVQGMQIYLLDADGIVSSNDVEYGARGVESTVALVLDRSFDRDKIKAQVAGIWEIEQEDFMLSPSLTFVVADDAELRLGGRVFLGDAEGNFGQYADNSYAELSIKYSF